MAKANTRAHKWMCTRICMHSHRFSHSPALPAIFHIHKIPCSRSTPHALPHRQRSMFVHVSRGSSNCSRRLLQRGAEERRQRVGQWQERPRSAWRWDERRQGCFRECVSLRSVQQQCWRQLMHRSARVLPHQPSTHQLTHPVVLSQMPLRTHTH